MKKNLKAQRQLNQTKRLLKKVGYKTVEKRKTSEWIEEYSASLKSFEDERTSTIPENGTKRDNRGFVQVSNQYVSAPAYNKGAYQVLSKDEVLYIGRK